MAVWLTIPRDNFEAFKESVTQKTGTEWRRMNGEEYEYLDSTTQQWMVEIHVDQVGDTSDAVRSHATPSQRFTSSPICTEPLEFETPFSKCPMGHLGDKCKCNLPVYRVGQDESIYKCFLLPKAHWACNGVGGMRKKSDGPGEMVSAFQDEVRGFGLKLDVDELATVNAWRAERYAERADGAEFKESGARWLLESPGVRYLVYGKHLEGYWTADMFHMQAMDVLDVLECLYPGYQIVLEVDWSQGHAKGLEDGLYCMSPGWRKGSAGRRKSPMTVGST
mmetsp:Transcript_9106/g.14467  ORF Transcript_9106/g.14467 Transcript_9106/m.14467 type:complete len:278 (+) Transcript_9106:969-1802(+)